MRAIGWPRALGLMVQILFWALIASYVFLAGFKGGAVTEFRYAGF